MYFLVESNKELRGVFLRSSSAESSRTDGTSDNEEKLAPFREKVQVVVGSLIDESLSTEPDQGKGRKKTVQVISTV